MRARELLLQYTSHHTFIYILFNVEIQMKNANWRRAGMYVLVPHFIFIGYANAGLFFCAFTLNYYLTQNEGAKQTDRPIE